MNSRGQAALEYLMTYGWALIVIAIVVGVLVFIVAAPTGNVSCSSNNPTKVNIMSNNISGSLGTGSLVITNTSGGQMTNLTFTGTEAYGGVTFLGPLPAPGNGNTIDNAAWVNGTDDLLVGNHTITIIAPTAVVGTYNRGTLGLAYTDPAGLGQTATITCQNMSVTRP